MRTTIYLPDDLHDQVKAAHLNVSAVCQEALAARLDRSDNHSKLVYELTVTARELLAKQSHLSREKIKRRELEIRVREQQAVIDALMRSRTPQSVGIAPNELAERREMIRNRGIGLVAQ